VERFSHRTSPLSLLSSYTVSSDDTHVGTVEVSRKFAVVAAVTVSDAELLLTETKNAEDDSSPKKVSLDFGKKASAVIKAGMTREAEEKEKRKSKEREEDTSAGNREEMTIDDKRGRTGTKERTERGGKRNERKSSLPDVSFLFLLSDRPYLQLSLKVKGVSSGRAQAVQQVFLRLSHSKSDKVSETLTLSCPFSLQLLFFLSSLSFF
jgi:hypothetical protein